MGTALWIGAGLLGALLLVVVYDVVQREHAILRNFPFVGHFRYWIEAVGPELRQYIVADNDEERPFSRDQRRWVYALAKKENSNFGFGTDNKLEGAAGYVIIKHVAFPLPSPHPGDSAYDAAARLPCARILGGPRGREHAFRPASVINTSAMSFGSLGAHAVEALSRGAKLAGCLQNTGEGGIAPHHLHGGGLIWQIGTGYFGCRDEKGGFSLDRLLERCAEAPVRALEIKLSQGAKPGAGGFLPGKKVTPEIARIRGIPVGKDCASPAGHTAFRDVDEMLDFVEMIADRTGLPVGIKSAVGEGAFWTELAALMESGERGVDFVSIDGGEGGTGAAPLVFSDHVALPFLLGFPRVYSTFAKRGVHERVVFVGAGKLGFPETSLLAMALGCDMIAIAREAMLSMGCIQAQRCHTDHCPTGVATHNRWLQRGLDPVGKARRFANYVSALRRALLRLGRACGVEHPALIHRDAFELLDGRYGSASLDEVFGYRDDWGLPPAADREATHDLMRARGESAIVAET
jgi:glutamate synthase domain-containing protein 2